MEMQKYSYLLQGMRKKGKCIRSHVNLGFTRVSCPNPDPRLLLQCTCMHTHARVHYMYRLFFSDGHCNHTCMYLFEDWRLYVPAVKLHV
jgi:hypothetical protein